MAELTNRVVALFRRADPEPDTELLGRFLDARDGEAFAALVRRHGPMVLAVCRRVLRHHADADDAFQATFLVLARRAGAVRPRSLLANWLYGVAYRTALEARRAAAVRRAKETKAAAMKTETVDAENPAPDLHDVLDRELAALPDVYRAAVVLCELEGVSRKEAAARLGWSEGTLSSRLSRARSLLARRLGRYGLAVPAGGLAALTPQASAGSVAALAESTLRLGTLVAVGEAAVSAPVAALMEGTMKAMLLAKLKTTAAALVVGCAVLMTATAGWQANAAGVADAQDREKPAAAPRKPARDADKDRIAELERERDRLLKELAELRDRLTQMERAQQLAAAKAALNSEVARLAADKAALAEAKARQAAVDERDRATVELRKLKDARQGQPNTTLSKPDTPRPAPEPLRPEPVRPENVRPNPFVPPAPPTPARPALRADDRANRVPPAPALPPAPPTTPANPPLPPTVPERLAPAAAKTATSVQVYSVADLAADEKGGEALAKVVRAVVEPQSWGAGAGVEYLPGGALLVVRQTAKGHEEVAKLLDQLKKHKQEQKQRDEDSRRRK